MGKKRLIDPGIGLICQKCIEKGPQVDPKEKKIWFYESYLAFLWSTINFLVTTFEKVHVPQSNSRYRKEQPDSSLVKMVVDDYKLFLWGLSLKDTYSEWPESIFKYDIKDGWQSRITNIWIHAVAFLFYHECAHLILEHSESNKENDQEADNYALNLVQDSQKMEVVFGSIAVVVASLFFLKRAEGISQEKHPDLDFRIDNFLTYLEPFFEEDEKRYFEVFASYASGVFIRMTSDSGFKLESEKDQDLWGQCMAEYDRIKRGEAQGGG